MPEVAVGLMAKFPELGKVKTRLAAHIGAAGALRIYSMLLQSTIETLRQLDNSHIRTTAFIAQRGMVGSFRGQYPGLNEYRSQVSGDLGKRMQSAFEQLLRTRSTKHAILAGADIPDLSAVLINEAATALEQNDLVFGPTYDGGYYLIGMRKVHSTLFADIEWSSESVLETSVRRAHEAGLSTKLLVRLSDLDTIEDFKKILPANRLIIDIVNSYLPKSTSRYREHDDG